MQNNEQYKIQIFRSLYMKDAPVLIRFALRYVPQEVAEDIVHEVFLNIWKNDKMTDGEIKFSYLLTAVRNKCINYIKQNSRIKKHIEIIAAELDENTNEPAGESIIEDEFMQQIHNQIEKLPPKCKTIFKMSYLEKKKSLDIAGELDLSIRTVEHQLYLGLKTIRSRLKP